MTDLFMTSPGIIERPALLPDQSAEQSPTWLVTVFDNETNTYPEVMAILMVATLCSSEEAYIETWEIDHFGLCIVHRDSEEACREAAKTISTIGIKVEVSQEPG